MVEELTHSTNGSEHAAEGAPAQTALRERGLMDLMLQGLRGLEAQLAEAEAEVQRLSVEVQQQRGAIGMVQQIKGDPDLQTKFLEWLGD